MNFFGWQLLTRTLRSDKKESRLEAGAPWGANCFCEVPESPRPGPHSSRRKHSSFPGGPPQKSWRLLRGPLCQPVSGTNVDPDEWRIFGHFPLRDKQCQQPPPGKLTSGASEETGGIRKDDNTSGRRRRLRPTGGPGPRTHYGSLLSPNEPSALFPRGRGSLQSKLFHCPGRMPPILAYEMTESI